MCGRSSPGSVIMFNLKWGRDRGKRSADECVWVQQLEPRLLMAAGAIDTTFGRNGSLTFPATRPADIRTVAAASLPGGKTLLLGAPYADVELVFARLNRDGSLDKTFGRRGLQTIQPNAGVFFSDITSMVLDARGRIYVGGDDGFNHGVVARFKPDGTIDYHFAPGGSLNVLNEVNALAVAPDDSIIIGGFVRRRKPVGYDDRDFGIARLNADGTLFPSAAPQRSGGIRVPGQHASGTGTGFGVNGVVTLPFFLKGGARTNSEINALAVDGQGRILAAGGGDGSFELARLNPDGSPDRSFSGDGRVLIHDAATRHKPQDRAFVTVAVRDSDGDVFAAGGIGPISYSGGNLDAPLAIVDFNADGSLDTHFARGGILRSTIGKAATRGYPRQATINQIAILPHGQLLVAGHASGGGADGLLLGRLNADGSADPSFGTSLPAAPGSGGRATPFRFLPTATGANVPASPLDPAQSGNPAGLLPMADGGFVVPVANGPRYDQFAALGFTADGAVDRRFGRRGFANASPTIEDSTDATRLAAGADGHAYVTFEHSASSAVFGVDANGQPLPPPDRRTVRFVAGGATVWPLAVQPDGKFLAQDDGPASGVDLVRFNPDGSVDTTFGAAGRVHFPGSLGRSTIRKLLLRADGAIVVDVFANDDQYGTYANDVYLLDASGTVRATCTPPSWLFFGSHSVYSDMTLTADGDVLMSTSTWNPDIHTNVLGLTRLGGTDLTPDATFGNGGSLTLSDQPTGNGFEPNGMDGGADVVAMLPDGRILLTVADIVGADEFYGSQTDALIALFPDGSRDTSFGDGGKVLLPANVGHVSTSQVLVQSNGQILVLAFTPTPEYSLPPYTATLTRYNPDGSPDVAFNARAADAFPTTATRIAIQLTPNGEALLVAGANPPPRLTSFDYYSSPATGYLTRINLA